MGTYLSKRKTRRNPEKTYLYSVTNIWDPQIKKIRKEQLYLGFFENGKLTLTESRIEVAEPLLIGSIYEEAFFQWQREQGIKKLIEQEEQGEIDLAIFEVGQYLVLSKVADDIGLKKFLDSLFEDAIAEDILSLAFYCVAEEYSPLCLIIGWSVDQILPSEKTFTEGRIVQSLEAITESIISSFLKEFAELPGIYSKQFTELKEALSAFRTKEELKKQFECLQYEGDVEDLGMDSIDRARSRLFIQLLAETLKGYIKKQLKEHKEKFSCEHIVDDWFWIIRGIQLIQVGNGRPYFKKFTENQREILNFFRIDLKNRQWPDLRKLRIELY